MTLLPLIRADLPRLTDVAAEFEEILRSGRITNFGPHVEAFEQEAAAYLRVPTATTSSATADDPHAAGQWPCRQAPEC